MIQIKTVSVTGWEGAIKGMRLPMQSESNTDWEWCERVKFPALGGNDYELARKLAKAGPDHGKFLRMIQVQAQITAPVYSISELSTYKVGTTMNSSSLQHKGASRDYKWDDFSFDDVFV